MKYLFTIVFYFLFNECNFVLLVYKLSVVYFVQNLRMTWIWKIKHYKTAKPQPHPLPIMDTTVLMAPVLNPRA